MKNVQQCLLYDDQNHLNITGKHTAADRITTKGTDRVSQYVTVGR